MEINKVSMFQNSPVLMELISSDAFLNIHSNLSRANGVLFPVNKISTRTRVKTKNKGKRKAVNDLTVYNVFCPIPFSTMTKYPPTSAAFFGVYNQTKSKLEYHAYSENINQSLCHILAVYMGHTASCLFRIPVDIYRAEKRAQPSYTPFQQIKRIVNLPNIWSRSFTNLSILIIRELPFCSIKFPLWEFLKIRVESLKGNKSVETYESAICGAIAGGTAASLTLPVDLLHKRIYVDKKSEHYKKWKLILTLRDMAAERGFKGMFAGIRNRFAMISFGGLLFFGAYEQKKRFLTDDDE